MLGEEPFSYLRTQQTSSMSDLINSLKEALQFSPDNVPLKLQLANLLLDAKDYLESENQYKEVLEMDKGNRRARAGLAKAGFFQGKYSTALVILEDLLETDRSDKKVLLLYAKALYKDNAIDKAIGAYREVLKIDPEFNDDELDGALRQSIGPSPEDEGLIDDDGIRVIEKPDIKFEDVGGMQKVKDEIALKIIQPMKHPELYEAYGKKIGGGILLYGPPGCGKTYLARATAGEINSKFMSIGISDVLDMWIGSSEKNLNGIFETARKHAPCVLFFDEVDALGASRSDMRQSAGRHLINQFLSELDGVDTDNEGLLVLGATNTPWHLDPAFRRPGRFDRIIFVQPPDQESRARILEILLKEKPIEKIDYMSIAKKTPEFSGADLKAVVDLCIEDKLSASFSTGVPSPMSTKDLLKAAKRHRASTKEWFNSAKNYALYANDSGLYDDILAYMNIKR